MKPWDIIGWFLIYAVVILVAIFIMFKFIVSMRHNYLYLCSRNIRPETGQVWMQDGDELSIQRMPTGHLWIKCGNTGWCEDDAGWKQRVRNRKLYLVRDSK